jgi:hypothetical protein
LPILSPSSPLFSLSLSCPFLVHDQQKDYSTCSKKIIPNAQKKTRCIIDHLKLGNEVKSFKIFYMQRKALTSLRFPMKIMFPQAIMEAADFL